MNERSVTDAARMPDLPAVAGPGEESPYVRRITLPKIATIAAIVAVLFFARDVFLPLSIAVLVAFALSPPVTRLRRLGLPQVASVLLVVTAAFVAIALFFLVVASQVTQLAQSLPTFQHNIIAKVESFQDSGRAESFLSRFATMITAINDEIGAAVPEQTGQAEATAEAEQTESPRPLPVEVIETRSPIAILQDLVLPLVRPIATMGLVVVVVIFMLLEREELRDRFIRLLGSNDLHRTTRVLEDAGHRVALYLLIQLLVNTIYALPIALGLWLIGVPNAVLWGLMTLVLRFVPYIGSILAAAFPLFLAFAISPGWDAVLWTIALFLVVELITSNVIEPKLYGSQTGVSPLAIIIAAIIWTWIWGPLGLVLSTPLTVCLVVLGRHIPQFEVFDIMFGDEPVLAPHARLYQRLLAGDAIEATFRAEEALEDIYLSEYYRDVGIPALLIAQNDYSRGVLTTEQEARLVAGAMTLVDNLHEVVADELEDFRRSGTEPAETGEETAAKPDMIPTEKRDGMGHRIVCIGGRSRLDDVAAAMLAQSIATEGAEVTHLSHTDLAPSHFKALGTGSNDCIVLTFLDPSPSRASLLHVRRIKRLARNVKVGVVIWQMPNALEEMIDVERRMVPVSPGKLLEAEEIGADFAASDLGEVLRGAFSDAPPKTATGPTKRKARLPAYRVNATQPKLGD